jgi:polyphosphate kinase
MERNLFRRVEIAFPVLDPALHAQMRDDLALYLADTADAWLLQPDGTYVRVRENVPDPVSAQARLLLMNTGAAAA